MHLLNHQIMKADIFSYDVTQWINVVMTSMLIVMQPVHWNPLTLFLNYVVICAIGRPSYQHSTVTSPLSNSLIPGRLRRCGNNCRGPRAACFFIPSVLQHHGYLQHTCIVYSRSPTRVIGSYTKDTGLCMSCIGSYPFLQTYVYKKCASKGSIKCITYRATYVLHISIQFRT